MSSKHTKSTKSTSPKITVNVSNNIDDDNKEAVTVLQEQGSTAFVENVFTDQWSGYKLTYAEMRCRYG